VFDKLEAELAKAVMSLPATKGFQFGSGFAGTGTCLYYWYQLNNVVSLITCVRGVF